MDSTAQPHPAPTRVLHPPRPAQTIRRPASAQEHRTLMGSFPTGVAVVTALDADRQPHGLTCTSLASVTIDPATLMVCLNLASGTLAAVRSHGLLAVNLLHDRARRAALVFSTAVPDRFDAVPWQPSPLVGMPWLDEDAFALAECVVSSISTVADHAVVIGEVVGIQHRPDVPLLYGMRQFASWSRALAGDLAH